jgi:hypothetical protein
MGNASRSHAGCDCCPMGTSPSETKNHPGGSALNIATFATVPARELARSAWQKMEGKKWLGRKKSFCQSGFTTADELLQEANEDKSCNEWQSTREPYSNSFDPHPLLRHCSLCRRRLARSLDSRSTTPLICSLPHRTAPPSGPRESSEIETLSPRTT